MKSPDQRQVVREYYKAKEQNLQRRQRFQKLKEILQQYNSSHLIAPKNRPLPTLFCNLKTQVTLNDLDIKNMILLK